MEILVAVDVSHGALARATSSGLERVDTFGGDPVAAATEAIGAGVRWIHVVDLDRAMTGVGRNLATVRAVAALGCHVQASGGIVSAEAIDDVLAAGAERAVIGSAALEDLRGAGELIARFGERVAVGIEARGDRIRARGARQTDLALGDTLDALVVAGAERFVVTAVPRVGSLSGPNVDQVRRVVAGGRPVIAAGGIASLHDLRLVDEAGAEGAIVGRAALEGSLDVGAAVAAFA